jgi:hypothetical protein
MRRRSTGSVPYLSEHYDCFGDHCILHLYSMNGVITWKVHRDELLHNVYKRMKGLLDLTKRVRVGECQILRPGDESYIFDLAILTEPTDNFWNPRVLSYVYDSTLSLYNTN